MNDPVRTMLGRRLRLGVIGGGPGSFIGGMHRSAARRDDRYELVAGALSSNPERSHGAAVAMGIPPDRAYATVSAMLDVESGRADGIDVVAIMTPNDSHFEYAMAAIQHGVDVICDKPMTNTLADAEALHAAAVESAARLLPHPQLHRVPDGAPSPGDGRGRGAGHDPPGPGRVRPGREGR